MTKRRTLVLLSWILVGGFLLRVWYASYGLDSSRFWDEGYALLNVESILQERTLKPAKSYYPSPLFNAPAAGLLAASEQMSRWTGYARLGVLEGDKFTPAGYFLCRLLQVFFGTTGIFLTFLVGRRMFSDRVGLVGALALAFMPWHIHASGIFKPDALLVSGVLLAFYWALGAIERPSLGRHILAGLGVAIAASAKLTGGLVAVPLTVGTVLLGWREPRRFVLLAVSGIVSFVAFVTINPYWQAYPVWIESLQRDYAMRARWRSMHRVQIPQRLAAFLLDRFTLGPVAGSASLLASLGLVATALRQATPVDDRVRRWVFLSFPIAYTVSYAAKTAYFKPNNFLPVVPFFCLILGWLLVWAWDRASTRVQRFAAPLARVGVACALVLWLVPQGFLYVYRSLTPTTWDKAQAYLEKRLEPPDGRWILSQGEPSPEPPWEGTRKLGKGKIALETVERLMDKPVTQLDLSDGEVFPASSLKGPDADFYKNRVEGSRRSRARFIYGDWLSLRGPDLVAIRRNHRLREPMRQLTGKKCADKSGCWAFSLPEDLEKGDLVSFAVWITSKSEDQVQAAKVLELPGREADLLVASRSLLRGHFVTRRFTLSEPEGDARLHVSSATSGDNPPAVGLCLWIARRQQSSGGG